MRLVRKNIVYITALIIVMISFLSAPGLSADGAGTTGASYLTLPVSPKSIAMGEAAAAVDNPFALFYNPALLSARDGKGLAISHSEWIFDDRYENLSGYTRVNDKFVLGAGLTFLYRPEIQGFDGSGTPTEGFTSNNYQAVAGCQYSPVPSVSAGINLKYFREKLGDWHAAGMAFDIGLLYSMEQHGFSAGFAVQNIGPDIKFDSINEPIPMTIRAGGSQLFKIDDDNVTVTLAADAVFPKYENIYLSTGTEIDLYSILKIRAGYCGQESRPGNGFSMGGGFNVRDYITLNYAFSPYGNLGSFHRISMHFSR